jgi:DNA-binding NtrC family response regulator
MPTWHLGPRALRVYEQVRLLIQSGSWAPGTKLPTAAALAAQFGVAPMTVRNVQDRLEEEGYIVRILGRGTFVRESASRAVLIVDDEEATRVILTQHVARAGFRAIAVADPAAALEALRNDSAVVLVLSDVRMPSKIDGLEFIRAVRQRWPELPLAAVTGFPDDLAELHGAAECPALVILKPIRRSQIEEALRLVPLAAPGSGELRPVLVADDDPELRTFLRAVITEAGHEVEEVESSQEMVAALRRRPFGHVLLDLRMPGGGIDTAAAIAAEHPDTAIVVMTTDPHDLLASARGPVTFLRKPFGDQQVRDALRLRLA